jgi:hypothetical protein
MKMPTIEWKRLVIAAVAIPLLAVSAPQKERPSPGVVERAPAEKVAAGETSPVERARSLIEALEAFQAPPARKPDAESIPSKEEIEETAAALAEHVEKSPEAAEASILMARLLRLDPTALPEASKGEGEKGADPEDVDVRENLAAHAFLDAVLERDPGHAEAHYWKGRLHTETFLRGEWGFTTRTEDLDKGVEHLRRAVAGAPEESAYRETLALALTDQGRPGEGIAVLRGKGKAEHPMIPLLADLELVGVPPGAEYVTEHVHDMTGMIEVGQAGLEDHIRLRVRTYEIHAGARQVEHFYRTRWPSFDFFYATTAMMGADGMDAAPLEATQFLRLEVGSVIPARGPLDIPDQPEEGILLLLMEVNCEEGRSLAMHPDISREPISFLTLMNFRTP